MTKTTIDDPSMHKVRALWAKLQAAGWTQQQLGEEMGYGSSAKQSVSQFLRSHDPQISMLRRFAKAVGVSLTTLVRE